MAKTVRKTKKNKTRRKVATARLKPPQIDVGSDERKAELEMKGNRLVVRLSRDSHPEIFELDRLLKQMRRVIATCQRKKKTRDVAQFLTETEKSMHIILKNHLEDAMRKYLR